MSKTACCAAPQNGGGPAQFNTAVLTPCGMKNQKTKRSVRYDQTDNDLTNYRTVDPAAKYETRQDEEIKRRKELDEQSLRER